MWCKWCDGKIPLIIDGKKSSQRLWHPHCAHEFNLHTRADTQSAHLLDRDGDHCRTCGKAGWRYRASGFASVTTQRRCFGWQPGVPGWWDCYWEGPDWRSVNYRELPEEVRKTGLYQEVVRVRDLEVDHRVPLWSVADLPDEERRWYFGPGNLWLLCRRCHKLKTSREAAERAALKSFAKAQIALPL